MYEYMNEQKSQFTPEAGNEDGIEKRDMSTVLRSLHIAVNQRGLPSILPQDSYLTT